MGRICREGQRTSVSSASSITGEENKHQLELIAAQLTGDSYGTIF